MTALTVTNVTDIIARLSANLGDTRMDVATVANDNTLYASAMNYAKNYAGTFPFMVSMFSTVQGHGQWLTNGQAAAVINCAVADFRYNEKRNAVKQAEQIVATPTQTVQAVANGRYTIVNEKTGGYRTIRLQTVKDDNGVKQWLAYLSGPDNGSSYNTVGFVQGTDVWMFNENVGKYNDIMAAAKFLVRHSTRVHEFGTAYAAKSGRCYNCGKDLTTPDSIAASLGPICREKLGF